MTLTKAELIKLLQEDGKPMDTEIEIFLECTNDDNGICGNITELRYDKMSKKLCLLGDYEQDIY